MSASKVPCPYCGKQVKEREYEAHLDSCDSGITEDWSPDK